MRVCRLSDSSLGVGSHFKLYTPKICREIHVSCDSILCGIDRVNQNTTLNNGYLGSRNDEERSEMRYVVRIAGCKRVIESLNAYCARGSGRGHVCLSVSRYPQLRLLGATLDLAVPDVSSGSAEAQWRASPPQVLGFGLSVVVSGMLPALFRRVCPVNAVPGVSRRELCFHSPPPNSSSPFDLRSGKATRRI